MDHPPYVRSSINSAVSSCVTGWCPDSSDVDAATSAISSYCDKYYAAVGSTPAAVPTSAIQDTSINVLPGATPTPTVSATATSSPGFGSLESPGATPTSTPSATATSSPGFGSQESHISDTIKIVGIVVGGVIALFGAILFCLARYKSHASRQTWEQQQYGPPGQTGAGQQAIRLNRWSHVSQRWKQQEHDPPGQTGAGQQANRLNRWSQVAQIVSGLIAVVGLAGMIVTVYFTVKPRPPS